MGFHQPPTYFVHQFTLDGPNGGVKEVARFRTEFEQWKSVDEWRWYDNAFENTRPFHGLIVAQLILNNWDLKTPNNRVYAATDASTTPRKLYVVRDLGSSLGLARQNPFLKLLGTPGGQGSKNDVDDFESQGFIEDVEGDDVDFDYRGLNQPLVDLVTVPDVIWACELLSRLSDEQWQAAFRAGAYPQDERRSLHPQDQGKDRAGSRAEGGYALDCGRCSLSSVTKSRCASTASGSSCSAA